MTSGVRIARGSRDAPREAIETMHRATAELKASGLENTALKAGDLAPEFSLFNQDHVKVNSRGRPTAEPPLEIQPPGEQ